jgi:hypothetical protein
MSDSEDMSWEIALPEPVEFRLYYDNEGSIITYTCDKLPGNYIVVDAQTFSEGRPDLTVVDGKLVKLVPEVFLTLLSKSANGTKCASEDVCIIVADDYEGDTTNWEIKRHEYKYS